MTNAGSHYVIQAINPALCRQRAAFMRTRADKAEADDLRASCLTAAADWDRLAAEAEAAMAEAAAAAP
jgi:hypothetical protein